MGKVGLLDFRKADFQLFRKIVRGIPWETALGDKRAEQNWQIFKEVFQKTLLFYKKSKGARDSPEQEIMQGKQETRMAE